MTFKPVKVLITGLPGSGKTTLVENLTQNLSPHLKLAGFLTREIREGGQRRGFELLTLDGHRALLSHVELKSSRRVGKYRVDVEGFEKFLEFIPFNSPEIELFILDEVGKMECLSEKFRELVLKLLESPASLLATVAYYGTPFIEQIKAHPGLEIFKISPENRDHIRQLLIGKLAKNLAPKKEP